MTRNFKVVLACAGALAWVSAPAKAGDGDYIAEVFLNAATFCPRGTTEADGKLLAIAEYSAVFSLVGMNYGGDGRTTFAVPDLRELAPPEMRYCFVLEGLYPSRP
ncbi:tail collar domain [Shimia isoporae]|uniref:Tail collar domain n=1 Tax=Shimia isoporae TaxID=647720 RepID=A0A4V2Q3R4_9RHOB|nr:tail fiber protein [Shimia isoporae]TCL08170.1 tail collar domain [Shimia isoporae]